MLSVRHNPIPYFFKSPTGGWCSTPFRPARGHGEALQYPGIQTQRSTTTFCFSIRRHSSSFTLAPRHSIVHMCRECAGCHRRRGVEAKASSISTWQLLHRYPGHTDVVLGLVTWPSWSNSQSNQWDSHAQYPNDGFTLSGASVMRERTA